MSCGSTPNVVDLLKQMVVESKPKTTQNVADLGKFDVPPMKAMEQDGNTYDWTKMYEKWDSWIDPDELAKQENEARERKEHAMKAPMGCNHDHAAERKLMEMTTQAKLTACDELRVLGNLFFKHGQYQRAAFHYHKALVYFEYVFAETDEEDAQADVLKLKLLLNFAACRLKTMHLDDAVHHANQALEIDHDNVKALYRRAQAYRLKDEFDLAQKDIARAIELSKVAEDTPSADALLLQEKKMLLAKMLAYKLRTKLVSSAMFGNGDKANAVDSFDGDNAPELCDFDVSDMTLNVSKSCGSGLTSSCDEFESLNTHHVSTRGLKELQRLIASLDN